VTRSIFHNRLFDRTRAVSAWRNFQSTKAFDTLAAAPLILVFGASGAHLATELWTTFGQIGTYPIDFHVAIYLLRQTMSLLLVILLMTFPILRNPAKAKAIGLIPRVAAFAGTYLGVALVWLPMQPIGLLLSLVSIALMIAGVGFSVYAILHLGRSFSIMAEARQLVTDGPYSRIRHPLYLGEAISTLGLMLQFLSPLAMAILVVQVGFQLVRMENEESVLARLFPEYEAYRLRTARLVPGVF
jgi:protein-S-isoprenylcysteine O-methyltransferase Ste14